MNDPNRKARIKQKEAVSDLITKAYQAYVKDNYKANFKSFNAGFVTCLIIQHDIRAALNISTDEAMALCKKPEDK